MKHSVERRFSRKINKMLNYNNIYSISSIIEFNLRLGQQTSCRLWWNRSAVPSSHWSHRPAPGSKLGTIGHAVENKAMGVILCWTDAIGTSYSIFIDVYLFLCHTWKHFILSIVLTASQNSLMAVGEVSCQGLGGLEATPSGKKPPVPPTATFKIR